MFSIRLRSLLHTSALLLMASAITLAQTPTAPPPPQTPSPPQRDATRPPGTEQRQTTPPEARPVPSNPTAPPGTERPAPQSPPGTVVNPSSPNTGAAPTDPQSPATTQAPTTAPTSTAPSAGSNTTQSSGSQGTITGDLPEPKFPASQPKPVPPLPPMSRLGVTTGETRPLSLNEAIRRALENNNDIQIARDNVRLAESLLRSFQGAYDPVLQFTPQINNAVSPQQSRLGGASGQTGTVKQTDFSFSPGVIKRFEYGGGQYEFFFNNNRRTTTSTFNNFNPVFSSNLGVTFTQPLWRDRAIDRTRHDIRVQRKRLEQSDADFRRSTIDVIAQVQRAYWDLVFALRDEQNQLANLNLARENFKRTEASVAAGASAPLVRAEIQTEVSNRESALLLATQNVSVAENNLKQLILRDTLSPEWSIAIVPTDQPSFDANPVNLQDAITEARANRPELRRLNLQQQINDIDLKYYRNQTRPRIDIQSTLSTTGLAGTPVVSAADLSNPTLDPSGGLTTGQVPLITGNPATSANAYLLSEINFLRSRQGLSPADVPLITPQTALLPKNLIGGYGQTLQNLFSFNTRNIVVGLTIQIPLRNRTAEANLASARIEREQLAATTRSQEQSIEVEVRNAAQAVETARRRVIAARQARESAEQQLAGEQRLFQVGRSTTFFLFQRENQLVNARNQELRSETDYNKALADLQRATSTTLRANNVIIETANLP